MLRALSITLCALGIFMLGYATSEFMYEIKPQGVIQQKAPFKQDSIYTGVYRA